MAVSVSPPSKDRHAAKGGKHRKASRSTGGILAGCRSAGALDSLPRNARGSNAAFHRLQARDAFFDPNLASAPETGFMTNAAEQEEARDTFGGAEAGDPAPPIWRRNNNNGGGAGKLTRSISLNRSSSSGASSALAKRAPPVSSSDFPPTSSDFDAGDGGFGASAVARPRTSQGSSSPPVQARPRLQSLPGPSAGVETGASKAASGSPTKLSAGIGGGASGGPARKRVIDKSMIGKPTNFQHTGHIGAASYNTALSAASSEALRLQLSEVTAALKFDDLATGSADAATAASAKQMPWTPTALPPALPDKAMPPAVEERQGNQPATSPLSSPSSTPKQPLRPLSPVSGRSTPSGSRQDLLAQSGVAPGSPSRSGRGNGAGIGAGGNAKRKPVPQALPELDFETQRTADASSSGDQPFLRTSATAPELSRHDGTADDGEGSTAGTATDKERAAEPQSQAQLGRQISVMGKLPSERDFAKFVQAGSPAGRRMSKMASVRSRSIKQGDTLKRWGLAEAFAESADGEAAISTGAGDSETSTDAAAAPAKQKKMVEGPAGTYITDTANVRWNSAMDEIRKALAEDSAAQREEEDQKGMQEGMRLADEVLKKLGVEEA